MAEQPKTTTVDMDWRQWLEMPANDALKRAAADLNSESSPFLTPTTLFGFGTSMVEAQWQCHQAIWSAWLCPHLNRSTQGQVVPDDAKARTPQSVTVVVAGSVNPLMISPIAPTDDQRQPEGDSASVTQDTAPLPLEEAWMPQRDADDLTKIKGIGVAYQRRLNERGIYHFKQIADWTPEEAVRFDNELRLNGRLERENWIKQARVFKPRYDKAISGLTRYYAAELLSEPVRRVVEQYQHVMHSS